MFYVTAALLVYCRIIWQELFLVEIRLLAQILDIARCLLGLRRST